MALGSVLGGSLAAAGTIVAGQPQLAKQAYGVGSSVGNLIEGGIEKRKADKLTPPAEDFERRNFLSEIQRKRKQLASGLDPLGTDIISSGLAQTQSNILRAGGGNVGATMSGLIGTSLATGEQLNRLVGQNQQAEGMYLQMANQVQAEMADRRYKQMLQLRAEHQAKATQLEKDGMTGLNASIMGTEGEDTSITAPDGTITNTKKQGSKGILDAIWNKTDKSVTDL